MSSPIIIGAGMSGLMAACSFPTARVFEAGPREQKSHKAVLRFRSPAVGEQYGIEFRKVTVRKGIYFGGLFVQPDVRFANLYSQKIAAGGLLDRSIWNIETVERWVAPEDFLEQLIMRCGDRITWNHLLKEIPHGDVPVISTMPMPVLAKLVGEMDEDRTAQPPAFGRMPVIVTRARIPNCDVHQTIYFPEMDVPMYRASITGDLLIVEAVDVMKQEHYDQVVQAFGFHAGMELKAMDGGTQQFGKIVPVDDAWRRSFIRRMTVDKNIYSLGRFAIWKNILADDVLKDIAVIKKLLKGDAYGVRLKDI